MAPLKAFTPFAANALSSGRSSFWGDFGLVGTFYASIEIPLFDFANVNEIHNKHRSIRHWRLGRAIFRGTSASLTMS
jgi:hypothetical protein